ncbi:DNA helicase [Babesia caballi]|uniref:DNA helicase n=1 Tax=Babesia caballi TaxID=5871 RepID=A0AAV4LYR7_BABCB|nr:DNA helicase [Babesia caballi]
MILGLISLLYFTILFHLPQHPIKIILETVGQLLDITLTLKLRDIFHLFQYLLNAITEVNTNLPKLRRNRIKRILKPRLATAHTFLARLDGFTELRLNSSSNPGEYTSAPPRTDQ